MMPWQSILFARDIALRYAIIRLSKSLITATSVLPSLGVTGTGAVFAMVISVAFKGRTALLTGMGIKSLSGDPLRVSVPPRHSAFVRAELLCFSMRSLIDHRSAAKAPYKRIFGFRVSAEIGFDRIGRKTEFGSNLLIPIAFSA